MISLESILLHIIIGQAIVIMSYQLKIILQLRRPGFFKRLKVYWLMAKKTPKEEIKQICLKDPKCWKVYDDKFWNGAFASYKNGKRE